FIHDLLFLSVSLHTPHPRSTLFPYTTLFRSSYQLLVVGGCQAHQPQLSAPYTREVWTAMARCSKKARRSRTPSRPAFCRNGTSLAGHSDSANKPRFALTRVCRGPKQNFSSSFFKIGSRFLSRFTGEKWFRQRGR